MEQYRKNLGKVSVSAEGLWDKAKSFDKLSIVYDEITEHAFLSKQGVPAGIDLHDNRYWMPLNVSGYSDSNIIIFTDKDENQVIKSYTLEDAIKSIASVGRKPGCIISFYNSNIDRLDLDGRWEIWQFNSLNVYDWENINNWINIYYNYNKFLGWFANEDFLKKTYPFPEVGCYAYVGGLLNEALIYRCDNKHVWVNTGINSKDYIKVIVDGNVTIGENGNWFSNGNDTGIKASIKGDNGKTPIFRNNNNIIEYSYDELTWYPISEEINTWFRWSNDNKIQITRDNISWEDLSPNFEINNRIQAYVDSISQLPSGKPIGTVYGVKDSTFTVDDPKYRVYVYTSDGWIDNGIFNGISAGIINDLTTGGADKALSAEMGKELNRKLDGISDVLDINAVNTVVDLSGIDEYNGIISSTIDSQTNYNVDAYYGKSIQIEIGETQKIQITSNDNYSTQYCLLKKKITDTSSISAHVMKQDYYVDTTGYLELAKASVITIDVPEDAKYLYIRKTTVQNKETILPNEVKFINSYSKIDDYEVIKGDVENNKTDIDFVKSYTLYHEKSIKEILEDINGTEDISITDFSSYEQFELQIVNGNWSTGGTPVSILIPMIGERKYSLIGSTNRNYFFSLLRSADNVSAGTSVDVCDLGEIEGTTYVDSSRYQVTNDGRTITFTTPSDCKYLFITISLGGTDCTPQSLSSEGSAGVIKEVAQIQERVSNIENELIKPLSIDFELGTIANSDGQCYGSTTTIRSVDFIPCTQVSVLFHSAKYTMAIYYYNEDKSYVGYKICDTVNPVKQYAFFKLRIVSPELTEDIGFNYVQPNDNNSILARYAEEFYLMTNLFTNPSGVTKFNIINVTDAHGSFDAIELGGLASRYCGDNVIFINTGDWVDTTPKYNGVESSDVSSYMELATKYGIYHCMGQHEVGFQNIGVGYDGKLKANSFTHEEVFDKFIEPMLPIWNLPEEDTMIANKQIYYYKDFDDYKIRLISLYQFNAPLIDDPNDSTKYKYIRCVLWYGQEQIDWLINRLKDTPDDYHVIIMLHEADGRMVDNDGKSSFSHINRGVGATNPIMEEYPVRDIIDAFIAKTSLTKTYTGVESYDSEYDDADYTDLTLTVNADFTNVNATFGMYFMGDAHCDIVGKMNSQEKQMGICTTSPKYAYDVIKGIGNKSTFATGFAISANFKNMYIGRIGVDTSIYMQDRRKDSFSIES